MLDYKAIRSLVAAGAVLAAGCATTGPSIGGAVLGSDRDGFVTIFDGSSLGDWEIYAEPEHELKPDAFYLDHGVLACNGRAGHWFRYREPLRDCVVRLEFRIARDTNSGVCMRTRKDGSPCFTGFEVQIVDDIGKAPDVHTTGAIYDVVCPMYNASRPIGEWNEMEITVAGPLVQVVLNGLKVIDTDFSRLTQPIGKFDFAYASLPEEGYLALQDHGTPVWYRNIRLKRLPSGHPGTGWGLARGHSRQPAGPISR